MASLPPGRLPISCRSVACEKQNSLMAFQGAPQLARGWLIAGASLRGVGGLALSIAVKTISPTHFRLQSCLGTLRCSKDQPAGNGVAGPGRFWYSCVISKLILSYFGQWKFNLASLPQGSNHCLFRKLLQTPLAQRQCLLGSEGVREAFVSRGPSEHCVNFSAPPKSLPAEWVHLFSVLSHQYKRTFDKWVVCLQQMLVPWNILFACSKSRVSTECLLFGAEFRRFSLDRHKPGKFEDFYKLVVHTHHISNSDVTIGYADVHGDLLPINNDDNFCKAVSSANPLLRVFIQKRDDGGLQPGT
ncbi:PREDICTED: uncharacterized protein LOC105535098 [Mandrillus leucophaeus]|uniref:uncharacterized protein LOC105535098 n=1 Tax=Mandrillus leucophaeus TaxID=9568 RepID=UPI0005F570FF|nr:PREDICTED: uncharacterized protein LOC105535098 [Mandrillus leucophaeus]